MEDAFVLALQDRQAYGRAATILAETKLKQDGLIDYARSLLAEADQELSTYRLMLTNPDILAKYVVDFFGPEGPYPSVSQQEAQGGFSQYQQQFQRPSISMPQPGGNQGQMDPSSFWSQFSQIADTAPEQAWQILSQAGPEVFRSKTLVVQ